MVNKKLAYKNVCLLVDNDGDIISVLDVKTLSTEQIKELKEKANLNIVKINNRFALLDELKERLEKVEKELAYNRGDITEEEYKGGND